MGRHYNGRIEECGCADKAGREVERIIKRNRVGADRRTYADVVMEQGEICR